MKVGDLVKNHEISFLDGTALDPGVGLVIEKIDHIEVPPVVKVMWSDGSIEKDWSDELELVNESC